MRVFSQVCCQNLWEATRKSQPIVAMWNPRAGATPSCIWWRAFLGILESSQLLTVLLNLPTVYNFHFLLLHSEDKLLRYSCNRSNRPLRSDCGMLWAKLTKLESPPAPPAIQFPQWSPPWLCLPARSVGSQPALMLLLRTRKFTSTSYQHIKTDMKCSFTKSTSGLLHTDHDPSLSMAAAPSLSHTCLAMISNMTLGRTSFQAAWGKSLTNFSTWKMFSGLTQR